MAPEKKNILQKVLLFIGGGTLFTIMTMIFMSGGFYSTTKAVNSDFKQHENADNEFKIEVANFKTDVLVKIKGVEVALIDLKDVVEKKMPTPIQQQLQPIIWNEGNTKNK